MNLFEAAAKLTMDTSDFVKNLKAAMNKMNDSKKTLSEYRSDVAKLAQQYKQSGMTSSEAWKKAYSEIDKSLYNLGQDATTNGAKIKSFGDIFGNLKEKITSAFSGFKSITESAGNSVSIFGDVLKANLLSEAITKGFDTIVSGFQKVGSMADNFVKSSISAGMSFDSAMSQVYATMGEKASEMVEYNGQMMQSTEALRQFAKEMGAATKYSATESAEALNYMALAGYNAETSMKMLPNVMNLASAGAFDLATASDMLTDTQTAFGMDLERTNQLVDEMAAAASNSNTSVRQLGDAFLTVGGLAKELNGGFVTLSNGTKTTVDGIQELEIALGAMANAGIKGSEAGTHMRNLLMKLSAPTEDATKLFNELGVSVFDDAGNMKSLRDVFGELQTAFAGMNNQQKKLEAISEIFNARDTASATALLAAVEQSWDSLGEAILNADGAAEKMAQTQMNNLAGAKKIFDSAKEGLQISISDALSPLAAKFVNFGAESLQALTSTIEKEGTKGLRVAVAKIVKNAGNLLYKSVPELLKNVVEVLTAIKNGIADGIPSFIDSARALIAKVSEYMQFELPEFINAGQRITSEIGKGLIKNLPYLVRAVSNLSKKVSKSITSNLPVIIPAVTSGILTIIDELTKPERITDFIDIGTQFIIAVGSGIGRSAYYISETFPEIVENLRQGFAENKDKIAGIGDTIISAIAGGFGITQNLEIIKEKISQGIQNIDFSEITSKLSNLIIGVTNKTGNLINGIDWAVIGNAIGEGLSGVDWYGILESVLKLIETTIRNSGELLKGIADAISFETANQIITIGGGAIVAKALVNGIGAKLSALLAGEAGAAITGFFAGVPQLALGALGGWTVGTLIRNAIGGEKIDEFLEPWLEIWYTGLEPTFDALKQGQKNLKDSLHTLGEEWKENFDNWETGWKEIKESWLDFWDSWEVGVNTLENMGGHIYDFVQEAKQWGSDMIDNFISGINQKWNDAVNAVSGFAEMIAGFIGFSEPEKGALSRFHTFAPDMIQLFADGIRQNAHIAETEVARLSGDIAESFRTPAYTGAYEYGVTSYPESSIPVGATVQNMTINVPGLNINSDSDMDRLADVLLEKIFERLETKNIQDNRGLGGAGW